MYLQLTYHLQRTYDEYLPEEDRRFLYTYSYRHKELKGLDSAIYDPKEEQDVSALDLNHPSSVFSVRFLRQWIKLPRHCGFSQWSP